MATDGELLETASSNPRLSGVVLAGGDSLRMGRDKALLPALEPEFETLLERQVALLRSLGLSRVFVSLGKNAPSPDPSLEVLRDPEDDLGPLAGIVQALRAASGHHVLVLAVDLGWMDSAVLAELIRSSGPDRGSVPRVAGRWEPLCAVYPPNALALAEPMLRSGSRSPTELVERLASAGAIAEYHPPEWLRVRLKSWNRPEDLPDPIRART